MANRSYKSILHNKKELHEEHSTHVEEIKEDQATEAADTTIEKVSEEFSGNGRVLIRPSGTERIVRVMIEGLDISDITDKANLISNKIKEKFGE